MQIKSEIQGRLPTVCVVKPEAVKQAIITPFFKDNLVLVQRLMHTKLTPEHHESHPLFYKYASPKEYVYQRWQ